MFKDEKHIGKLSQIDTVTFSGCCANGNIKLPPIKNPPDLLKDLLTGNTPRDQKFPGKHKGIQFQFSIHSPSV